MAGCGDRHFDGNDQNFRKRHKVAAKGSSSFRRLQVLVIKCFTFSKLLRINVTLCHDVAANFLHNCVSASCSRRSDSELPIARRLLEDAAKAMATALPLIQELRHPAMRHHHWQQLMKVSDLLEMIFSTAIS